MVLMKCGLCKKMITVIFMISVDVIEVRLT